MSATTNSTTPSLRRWNFRGTYSHDCAHSLCATEILRVVREPLRWKLASLRPAPTSDVAHLLTEASLGTAVTGWTQPSWLLPHQVPAARRLAGSLDVFGGALLADGVGLGKTYTALALATRVGRTTAVVPACILPQWERTATHLGIPLTLTSHESLSRSAQLPPTDLLIVDEAHRFRNAATLRYDRLARGVRRARVLLVTATPVVNHPRDLVHLIRLFLPDAALALLGVPSLERAAAARDIASLANAVGRLTVARPASLVTPLGCSMPSIREGTVMRTPTADPVDLERFSRAATCLAFPGVPPAMRHLLRSHLLHRLASSLSAFRGTVKRHLAYVDRALAGDGEQVPTRRSLRQVLGPGDDLQFELWGAHDSSPAEDWSIADLVRERSRLVRLLESVDPDAPSPKADRLEHLLSQRPGKTLVFTSASETAAALGRRLGWRRVGVIAAGRGRIATGPAGVQRVLDLFAPRARGIVRPDTERTPLDTLIATDLVSEGLDLQDADAVVHYDLPWTPVRLAQRLGRVWRLGSAQPQVHITWFAPPILLEQHLQLERRLSHKAQAQLALAVPATSQVGRAQIFSQAVTDREALCLDAVDQSPLPAAHTDTPCAVVRGPLALVAALRWHLSTGHVDEIVALGTRPPRLLTNQAVVLRLMARLRNETASDVALPTSLRRSLLRFLRARLRQCRAATPGSDGWRLRRRVLRVGVQAGKQRDRDRLELLDRVLELVHGGCGVGAQRALGSVLNGGAIADDLAEWLADTPERRVEMPSVQITAILAGDGSEDR
jgi:hypothetical protein